MSATITITLSATLTARVQALVDAGLADWDNVAEAGIERECEILETYYETPSGT